MKRTAKNIFLVMVMAILLLGLTGCGNKLVATKEEEDSLMGKYKETIEIKFKGDKASQVKITYAFEENDKAEDAEKLFEELAKTDGIEAKRSGKKVTLTIEAKAYKEFAGEDITELSKDEIKENLEKADYKVK